MKEDCKTNNGAIDGDTYFFSPISGALSWAPHGAGQLIAYTMKSHVIK